MRVGHHRAGAVRGRHLGEFSGGSHDALQMHMPVYEAGNKIGPGGIALRFAGIIAHPGNKSVLHCDIARNKLARKNIKHPRIFKHKGGGTLFLGYGDKSFQGLGRN